MCSDLRADGGQAEEFLHRQRRHCRQSFALDAAASTQRCWVKVRLFPNVYITQAQLYIVNRTTALLPVGSSN